MMDDGSGVVQLAMVLKRKSDHRQHIQIPGLATHLLQRPDGTLQKVGGEHKVPQRIARQAQLGEDEHLHTLLIRLADQFDSPAGIGDSVCDYDMRAHRADLYVSISHDMNCSRKRGNGTQPSCIAVSCISAIMYLLRLAGACVFPLSLPVVPCYTSCHEDNSACRPLDAQVPG